jgi:peptide/nickel transport system substrate-binding protein
MRGSRSFVLTFAMVAGLVLAGCGGGDHRQPRVAQSTTTPELCVCDGPDPFARGPMTIHDAQQGGTVTVLVHHGLGITLDPAAVHARDTLSIDSGLITRSLTQYRYDRATHQMVLMPDLAVDLGQHNDDFTRWKFVLRTGVTFENGEPVTAKTVAVGIRRCLDAATFRGGTCQRDANGLFKAVHAHGPVLTLLLDRPFPDLAYLAALPAMGPVPLSWSSNPTRHRTHPLATGPYKIVSYRPGHELVLTRNPAWDPASDVARTQYPDGYYFRTGLSSHRIDRLLLADAGAAQTTLTYDDVLAVDHPAWLQSASSRLTLGGTPCTTYLALDNRTLAKGKLADKRVRVALSWAYPYRKVLRTEGEIPGVTAIPASNLMPPGVPGRTAHHVTARRGFDSNPGTAQALLRSAHATGYEIRFPFDPRDAVSVRAKDLLVRALTASGFTPRPLPSYAGTNLRTVTRCADWPSGSQWIEQVYASTRLPSLKTVERRIAAIHRMPIDQQAAPWNRLDVTALSRWFPVIPVSYGGVDMAHGSRIMGMHDDNVRGMPTWNDIWVAS